MSIRLKCHAALLGGASLFAMCAPGFAQEEATASGAQRGGDVIVVTATKREQTLQEVPVAVSVISGERLDEAGVSAVESIVDVSPSLTFTQGANSNNSSLTIRGIGTTVFSSGVESSVSVVIDEVVMGREGPSFQDLIDVERVEVLRGPQGTLFGKNASAGVVSVTTKAPSDVFTGNFDTLVTEDGEFQQRGTVSGPLSDNAGFRLSAFYKEFDGNTTNFYDGETLNGSESWGLRGKLVFDPTDALSLTLIGDFRKSDGTPMSTIRQFNVPANASLIAPAVPGEENTDVNADGEIFSTTEQYGFSGKAEYEFANGFTLTSISAYRNWSFDNNVDVDNTSLPPMPGPLFTWNINHGTNDLAQFSQEVRLTSPEWDQFDFLVGGYFFKLDIDSTFARRWEQVLSGVVTGRSSQFTGLTDATNFAGFASGNLHFTDSFTAFGGVRLLHEKLEWDVFRDPANVIVPGDIPLPGEAGTFADFDGSIEDTVVIGNAGLRHEVGDYGNVYASYSRGYKGAGFNVIFAAVDGDPVEAENVNAYEAGLKMGTSDGVFSTNIALFYTDYQNYQSQSRGESEDAPFILRNAGDVVTKGIEAEFFLKPTDLLDVSLGIALIDAQIDKFPGGPCYANQTAEEGCVDGAQDLSGATLPNAPDVRVTGFAKQTIPFESLPFDGFVQMNAIYQSEVQFALTQDPRTIQDGYAILNAAIGVKSKDGHYSFQIIGRNLTDKFYAGELFPSPSQGGRVTQTIPRASQRYFGVQGSFNF